MYLEEECKSGVFVRRERERETDGMLRGGWWHDRNGGKDENGGGVGAVLDEEEEKMKRGLGEHG